MSKKARKKRIPRPAETAEPAPSPRPAVASIRWPSWLGSLIRQVLFFSLFYFYMGWIVEPHLIFQGNGVITNFPSFYTTWGFFSEHLSWPGGPLKYLSAFLSQWFYYSPVGALVVTVQAWGLCGCIGYMLGAMRLRPLRWIGYVPAMLLVVVYGRYTYHFPTTLALLTALAMVCIYLAVSRRCHSLLTRSIWFGAMSLCGYYLAGGAFFVFVLTVVLHELLIERRWPLVLAGVVAGVAIPYVLGVLIFGVNILDAYLGSLPINWRVLGYGDRSRLVHLIYAMYLLVPVSLLAGFVAGSLWKRIRPTGLGRVDRLSFGFSKWATLLRWGVGTAAIVGIGAGVAHYGFDRKSKANFAVDYFAYHGMWREVLAESVHDLTSPEVIHAVDRALCHTGQMGDEMFRWPQNAQSLFLMDIQHKETFWQSFGVYLDLGFVNMAEHLLTESLEGLGDRPMVLQQLAWINMIKDNTGTARIYLGRLSQTLFHAQWAREYLDLLDRDPNLSTDEAIQNARAMALDKDMGFSVVSEDLVCQWLLEKNSTNRMAFEYLMASYLIEGQLKEFASWIQKCRQFGYKRMPRHFEEGALVYAIATKKDFYLGGYTPSDEIRRRLEDFGKTMQRYHGNARAAYNEMAKRHAGSYFFYNTYSRLGQGR